MWLRTCGCGRSDTRWQGWHTIGAFPGRDGTSLELVCDGLGQRQTGLGLEWQAALASLSCFACPLAGVGGRSGGTEPSKGRELCSCFLERVGLLRHGAHLQLPTLSFSAKHLASVTIQEWYETRPQGSWCRLTYNSTTQNSRDYVHCPVTACFPCTTPLSTSSLWASTDSAPQPHQTEGAAGS